MIGYMCYIYVLSRASIGYSIKNHCGETRTKPHKKSLGLSKVETGKMSEKRKRVEVFLLLQLGFFYFSFSFSQSYVRIISLGYVFKKDRVKIKHQKNEFQGS